MGIMFLVAAGVAIFLVIFRLVKNLVFSDYKYYRVYMTVHDTIFYNFFIRYVILRNYTFRKKCT